MRPLSRDHSLTLPAAEGHSLFQQLKAAPVRQTPQEAAAAASKRIIHAVAESRKRPEKFKSNNS